MAAVDGKLVRNWTGGRHFLENALPDTVLGPTIVAVVDGRRWPIGWRNVELPERAHRSLDILGEWRALFAGALEVSTNENKAATDRDIKTTLGHMHEMTNTEASLH
jgi:hypothetical protein